MTDPMKKLVLAGAVAASLVPTAASADERDWRRDDRRYEEACRYDPRYCDDRRYNDRYERRPQRYDRGASVQRLSTLIRRDDRLIDWAIQEFDYDRNGRLGEREAKEANLTFFHLADRNRTGYIEGREFHRARDYVLRDARYAYDYRR